MGEIRVRAASAAEVLSIAAPLLPDTIELVADLEGAGLARRTRPYLAEVDGRPLGAVVISERCRWRWYASPVLLDPGAARALARVVDSSPAWEVGAAAPHCEPLIPHLTRVERRAPKRAPFFVVDALDLGEFDPRCRVARADDLDALVDLYAGYELMRIPTRGRLREVLARLMESGRPVVVAEVEGRLAGAVLCVHRTAAHDLWAEQTVLPEFRRQRLGLALGVLSASVSARTGRGICGVRAPTSPLTPEMVLGDDHDAGIRADVWTIQHLQSPRRFPGHRRLRRAYERAAGRLDRRAAVMPEVDSAGGAEA